MKKDSFTFKVFQAIQNNRACTTNEVVEATGIPRHYVPKYVDLLLKEGLIYRGKKIQSPDYKDGRIFVYGITPEDIKRKEKAIVDNISEEQLLSKSYKRVFGIVKEFGTGIIPSDIQHELKKEDLVHKLDYIGTVLRDLWKRGLLKRSEFRVPAKCVSESGRYGVYVYGMDMDPIKERILELAPKEVSDSYFRIQNEAKVYASFYLKQLTGMTISWDEIEEGTPQDKQWLVKRFYKSGWLKYTVYNSMGYYYRNSLPDDIAMQQIREIHPKAQKYRLQATELGRISEKRAIFVFTMYAKFVWGRRIKIPEGFPKNIPSWFNPKHIEKYTHIEKTKNGKERRVIDCGVWKFDRNPLDFFILEDADPLVNTRPSGFAINCKYTTASIGGHFLLNMMATLREGFIYSYKGKKGSKTIAPIFIPEGGILKPVVMCKSTSGAIIWKRARKYGAMVITLNKLKEMETLLKEKFNIAYEDSKEVDKLMERIRLYEHYQQNALGEDAVKMALEATK